MPRRQGLSRTRSATNANLSLQRPEPKCDLSIGENDRPRASLLGGCLLLCVRSTVLGDCCWIFLFCFCGRHFSFPCSSNKSQSKQTIEKGDSACPGLPRTLSYFSLRPSSSAKVPIDQGLTFFVGIAVRIEPFLRNLGRSNAYWHARTHARLYSFVVDPTRESNPSVCLV